VGIVKAMSNPESAGKYIYSWKDYMCSTVYADDRYNKEADIIIKLAKAFPFETKGLTDVAVELYKKCLDILELNRNRDKSEVDEWVEFSSVSENKLSSLVSFITENISESTAYEPWCDIQSENRHIFKGSARNGIEKAEIASDIFLKPLREEFSVHTGHRNLTSDTHYDQHQQSKDDPLTDFFLFKCIADFFEH
jgi:hypothetical protein